MSSKKKVKEPPVPVRKTYFLFNSDLGDPLQAEYDPGAKSLTITYSKNATTTIVDTGSGYEVTEKLVLEKKPKVTMLDYSVLADLMAAMKIFKRNNLEADEGEYWTIFQGNKI